MTAASFSDLVALLTQDGIAHRTDPETQSVEIPTQKGALTGDLLLRWERDSQILQSIQPLPFEVPPDRIMAAADAIARINHALVLPGFGLDHEHRLLYFRLSVPRRPPDGSLEDDEIRRLFSTTVETAASFLLPLRGVALEGAPPKGVLAAAGPGPLSRG